MYVPPTMLPHRLRLLVDPPMEFPEVRDDPAQLITSSRWSRLRKIVRGTGPAQATTEPRRSSTNRASGSLVGRSTGCSE